MFKEEDRFKIKNDYVHLVENAKLDKTYTVHRIVQGVDASSNLIYFKNDIDEISMVIEIYCELIE